MKSAVSTIFSTVLNYKRCWIYLYVRPPLITVLPSVFLCVVSAAIFLAEQVKPRTNYLYGKIQCLCICGLSLFLYFRIVNHSAHNIFHQLFTVHVTKREIFHGCSVYTWVCYYLSISRLLKFMADFLFVCLLWSPMQLRQSSSLYTHLSCVQYANFPYINICMCSVN